MTSWQPRVFTPRRLAAVTAVAALVVGGCAGTGNQAQTNAQYQAGVGANVRTGAIQLFNALAVDNGDGTSTFSAAILNRSDRTVRLTGAHARASNGSAVKVTVAPAAYIRSGQVFTTGPTAAVLLSDNNLAAGQYVTVTLTFSRGESARVDAPVVARSPMYDDVATTPGGAETEPTPAAPAG